MFFAMCFATTTTAALSFLLFLQFFIVHSAFAHSAYYSANNHHRHHYRLLQSSPLPGESSSSTTSGIITSSRAHLGKSKEHKAALLSSSTSSLKDASSSTYYFTSFDPVVNETHNTVLSSLSGGMQQSFQLGPFSFPIEQFTSTEPPSSFSSSSVPTFATSTAISSVAGRLSNTSNTITITFTSSSSTRPSQWPLSTPSERYLTSTTTTLEGSNSHSQIVASSFTIPLERNESASGDVIASESDEAAVAGDSIRIEYRDLTQHAYIQLIFLFLYYPVMIFAVIGNLLVCYSVMSNRKMQTVVNYYIVNLGLCDFLVGSFVLPSKMLELLVDNSWYLLSNRLCMAMFFFQTIVVFASVLTLVATCFERYFAIVHPLKSRMQQSKRRTCRILVAVWALAAFGSAPNFLSAPQAHDYVLYSDYGAISRRSCIPSFSRHQRVAYFTALFVAFYLIPLMLIAFTCFCIARSLLRTSVLRRQGSLLRQEVNRRKVGKMILIVVLSFTVSWTPYFLVSIITQYQERNFMRDHDFYFTMLCINLFAFLHSAINPVIYACMSTRFRKSFMRILRLAVCCGRQRSSGSGGGVNGVGGQTSFNDPPTSSRGSMVNVNVSVHPVRMAPPPYRAQAVNGKRSSFEAFKLSSLIGRSWARQQSSSSFSSSGCCSPASNGHTLQNGGLVLNGRNGDKCCCRDSSSGQAMLMREVVNGRCSQQRRSLVV